MDIIKTRNREQGTGNGERGTSTVNKKVKNENKTEKGLLNDPAILVWNNRQHFATPLVPRDMSELGSVAKCWLFSGRATTIPVNPLSL